MSAPLPGTAPGARSRPCVPRAVLAPSRVTKKVRTRNTSVKSFPRREGELERWGFLAIATSLRTMSVPFSPFLARHCRRPLASHVALRGGTNYGTDHPWHNRRYRRASLFRWSIVHLKPPACWHSISPITLWSAAGPQPTAALPRSVTVLCALLSAGMGVLPPPPNAGALSAGNGSERVRQEAPMKLGIISDLRNLTMSH